MVSLEQVPDEVFKRINRKLIKAKESGYDSGPLLTDYASRIVFAEWDEMQSNGGVDFTPQQMMAAIPERVK